MFDAIVVGAGPAGTNISNKLSSDGFRVLLVDIKEQLGIPNHCSGLVDERVVKIVGDDLVIDKPLSAEVTTPKESFTLQSNRMFVIDRVSLDRKLGEIAVANGTVLRLRTKFIGFSRNGSTINVSLLGKDGIEIFETKYLIGADGPTSLVRRQVGIDSPRLLPSLQYDVVGRQETVKIHLDRKLTPDFFSWEIPSNLEVEIGASGSKAFEAVSALSKGREVIKKRGGLIPMGPTGLGRGDVFLVGDSAGLNKATTGGGLYAALKSGESLAYAIREQENVLNNYKRIWFNSFGKEIDRDFVIRKFLDKFEKYYNFWLPFAKANIKEINKIGDVDYPSNVFILLAASSLVKIPKVLEYAILMSGRNRSYSR